MVPEVHKLAGSHFEIERRDAHDWHATREDWAHLHETSEAPTFFLSPTWMDAWLAVFGPSMKPEFLCLRDGDSLIGVTMLARSRLSRGPISLSRVWLNTAGEGSDSPMVEHNALLCRPEHRALFAEHLAAMIAGDQWDEFGLASLRQADHAALAARIEEPKETIWRDSPFVDLAALRAAGQAFLDSVSANTRQQIRRSMRLYAERGTLVLEVAQDAARALHWFDEMIDLHEAVWRERGKPGAFASPRQRNFHRALIAAGAPYGVQLLRVRAGSQTIGVLYNLCYQGHISYYQSGFRYEEDNRLKPGLVCHALVIQHALDNAAHEYDLLAVSDQGARYKTSLANGTRALAWTNYRRRSTKVRMIDAISAARQRWSH